MGDRTLVKYQEQRVENGPYWELEIDRSASGKADVLITIKNRWRDGSHEEEKTIVVENALEVLKPAIMWLIEKEELKV